MTTVRGIAKAAYQDRREQIELGKTEQYKKLRDELVRMGLDEDLLRVTPWCVEADREALSFRFTDEKCAYEVRDHDWPEGVWRWFANLQDLGQALERPIQHFEIEAQKPCLEERIVSALERIADALEERTVRELESIASVLEKINDAIELPA